MNCNYDPHLMASNMSDVVIIHDPPRAISYRMIRRIFLSSIWSVAFLSLTAIRLYAKSQKVLTAIRGDLKSTEDTTVYAIVEVQPEFPGGNRSLFEFIQSTSKYPVSRGGNKTTRPVSIRLLIEKDGTISDVSTLRSEGQSRLEDEAKRIAGHLPRWRPGYHGGRRVRTFTVVTIYFKGGPDGD